MSPSGIADFTGFFLKPAHKSRVTRQSQSSDWYTPKFIFDALGLAFDLDPAHPGRDNPHCVVPTRKNFTKADDGLRQPWHGLVWLNPPFGGRRGQVVWLRKFFTHGNGIALVAARTSGRSSASRRGSSRTTRRKSTPTLSTMLTARAIASPGGWRESRGRAAQNDHTNSTSHHRP